MQCLDDGAKNAKSKIYYRLLLQGDLNSWLGSVEVPWDQRPRNDNRKNLKSFLFQTILLWWMLWNVVITRTRNRQWQIQNSNMFFFVVCKRLLSHVTEILIDDTREMTITNYKCTRGGKSPVDSDYMTMMLKINLNVLPHKPQRVEMFH